MKIVEQNLDKLDVDAWRALKYNKTETAIKIFNKYKDKKGLLKAEETSSYWNIKSRDESDEGIKTLQICKEYIH
jgi:hypothetical protein